MARADDPKLPEAAGAAEMAEMLQLSPRRLQQLATEGIIPKISRGRYELAPVVQAYINYLRERTLPGEMNAVLLDEALAQLRAVLVSR
jgi:phage terminase Nu1 subunit (DNA packaging protein)